MHELDGDWIEQRGIGDWYSGLPVAVARETRAAVVPVGSALVAVLPRIPSAVYSRVLGLGVREPATPEQVDQAFGEVRRLGARTFFHVGPYSQPPELGAWLAERGLVRYQRSWMRFVREREAVPAPRTDLSVRPATSAEASAFDAVVRDAFEIPEAGRGMFAALVGRPGWHTFVALDGERVAGGAALFVEGDLGWLAFGAVDRASRNRGGQSALIAARLGAALDLGCRAVFVETGESVPGDPQHSYHNILRAGFRELVLRDNYLYPGAEAQA